MYVCMCMYVYMYVCVYVCMYVVMRVCMYVCVYVWMYVYMYVCMYVRMCVRHNTITTQNTQYTICGHICMFKSKTVARKVITLLSKF
jgi:hypothetical protein